MCFETECIMTFKVI